MLVESFLLAQGLAYHALLIIRVGQFLNALALLCVYPLNYYHTSVLGFFIVCSSAALGAVPTTCQLDGTNYLVRLTKHYVAVES